ncbi:MAG: flavin-containing monooxygenase, partial [Pseudomonadales bacterium]
IPSMEYSYQFSEELQQEWEWTERYATQPEILAYAEHVVDRFGLGDDIQLNTKIATAEFSESASVWTLTDSKGDSCQARYVIAATGCLSVPNFPDLPGLDEFNGHVYHTGLWPHEGVDLADKQVAVIGTGSSAIQSLPLIASQASAVTVFQRTPNYSIPAWNEPLAPDYVQAIKSRYREYRQENWQRGFGADFGDGGQSALEVDDTARLAEYEARWQRGGLAFLAAYNDLVFNEEANDTARAFFAEKIRDRLNNSAMADKLIPDTPIGCKRLCVDTDYYETYNQPHVTLVDLHEEPIEMVDGTGIVTAKRHYEADLLVLATGFDAMTGALTSIDVTGRAGRHLREKWAEGPRAYLGLATEGFPNLFMVTGPGSPSVLSNM